jgi:hemoglobin-like flavoprotein
MDFRIQLETAELLRNNGRYLNSAREKGIAMTPEQQDLVQSSFAKVAPIADEAAKLFYADLFERDPTLRPLFADDLTEQRKKLISILATAVANVKTFDKISDAVRQLGARHVGYGVLPSHYPTVGASLIATLEKGLGDDFTPAVKGAWLACYAVVSAEMLKGAESVA